MKMAKRSILSFVALLVVAAVVIASMETFKGGAAQPGGQPGKPGVIQSDGKEYPVKKIENVKLKSTVPKETLPAVGNKETLLKLLMERGALYDGEEIRYTGGKGLFMAGGLVLEDAAEASRDAPGDLAPVPAADNSVAGGSPGHSETNEQVEGVSEGDIVKTDGRYIYALSGNILRIIEVSGVSMKVISSISFEDMWGAEFYLMGDQIAVIGQKHIQYNAPADEDYNIASDMLVYGGWYGRNSTVLMVYDISDRANPTETRRVEMEGYNVSTRVIGDIVYLVTNKYVSAPFERADSDIILPCVLDTAKKDMYTPIPLDQVFYIPETDDASYLLIGAVDINSDEPFEPQAYLGAGSQLYMSRNAIYVTKYRWETPGNDELIMWGGRQLTDILRFDIDGTDVQYAGMGTVEGHPINQYSMDEYNGHFRIATTQRGVGTVVWVLDGGMKTAGRTEALMPNEMMQSMRFMGDMGYVVTFENTDPLFTIDLSDPANPTVLGELKIPGFSQYLHPVGNGLLMGIGRDTEELFSRDGNGKETVIGFRDVGMKISLFDVSDPYNPKEVDVLTLGEGWAEVSHNPRALMCDPSRGLYGFTMERWNSGFNVERYVNHFAALLLRVEGSRLSIAADLETGDKFAPWNSRLAFIGDTLYLSHDGGLRAYDYYTFELAGTLGY
ncbi:MAG: beta-propeller domain-containing protein [Oscillospiraceae bacterium]|nr:beta-propeller domain-containing protein [Oscillospiraceae bacterium]